MTIERARAWNARSGGRPTTAHDTSWDGGSPHTGAAAMMDGASSVADGLLAALALHRAWDR